MTPRSETRHLSGWKQIADYMGKGVRTIQRYERDLNLPVHRPAHKSRSSVIAFEHELDAWATIATTEDRTSVLEEAFRRCSRVGSDFLRIDSEIALTFSGIALGTNDRAKKIRTRRSAREAYDVITRLREKLHLGHLDDAHGSKLTENLQRLQSELRALGEDV